MAKRPDPDQTPSELDLYIEPLGDRINAVLPMGVHFVLILYRPAGARFYARIKFSGIREDGVRALEGALDYLQPDA